MLYDFFVLVLALCALLRLPGRSGLWKLLILDGLVYFLSKAWLLSCHFTISCASLVAFTCYAACTVMVFLNLNTVSIFMVSDPATIIATMAANRSFLRIGTFTAVRCAFALVGIYF